MAQLPPGNPSAEKALLGAFLKNNDLFLLNASTLEEGIFSYLPHQKIYEAMKPLFEKNHRCDLVSLIDALQDEGRIDDAGGVAYVSSLTDGVPYLENVDHFLHILKEKHLKRRLFTLANDLMGQINQESTPSEALIGDALMELSNLAQDGVRRGFVKLSEVNELFLSELEARLRGISSGLPLGYEDIDKRTGGLHKQNLIIIAGRLGMEKTALALNFAYRVAKEGKKSVFLSGDEQRRALQRLICIDKNFPAQKIRDAQLSGGERGGTRGGKLFVQLPDLSRRQRRPLHHGCLQPRPKAQRDLQLRPAHHRLHSAPEELQSALRTTGPRRLA